MRSARLLDFTEWNARRWKHRPERHSRFSFVVQRYVAVACALLLLLQSQEPSAMAQTAIPQPDRLTTGLSSASTAAFLDDRDTRRNVPMMARDFAFTGAGSCSAAGCHGGNGTRPKFALASRSTENFSSYSTWIQKDPHSRAYQVLLEEKSVRMHQALGAGWNKPHEEKRCLTCHSTLDPMSDPSSVRSATANLEVKQDQRLLLSHDRLLEGISCEACHGPARDWLAPHTELSWQTLSSSSREKLGFQDLRHDLVTRARTCVRCHVGGAGRDMNHDMIAAGHPRLNFEFSAYHANVTAHWSHDLDRQAFVPQDQAVGANRDSIRETKLWLVGQLATAEAALNLLEVRTRQATEEKGTWPEFSEYSCYACHHDLQSPSWRQRPALPGRKLGGYPWGTWNFPLLNSLALEDHDQELPWSKSLNGLSTAMSRPAPTPAMVLEHLNEARKSIRQELERHRPGRSLTRAQTINLLKRVLRNGADVSAQDWDGAAQTYLATLSLYQGQLEATGQLESLKAPGTGTQAIQASLTSLRDQLAFPQPREGAPRIESPRDFDTERIRTIQLELRRIESALQRSSR